MKETHRVSPHSLDLNQFKIVNDTIRHDIGDQLLKVVATRLKLFENQFEMMARQGDDEFTLILEGVRSYEQLHHVANQLLRTLQTSYQIDCYMINCPPSIGISCYRLMPQL